MGKATAQISFTPRGLSRMEAARYIGIGPSLFDEMVKDGRMPPAKQINSRTVWDRNELDVFFDELPTVRREGEGESKAHDPFSFMEE